MLNTLVAHGYFDRWIALPDASMHTEHSSSRSENSVLRADESVALVVSAMEMESTRCAAEVKFTLCSSLFLVSLSFVHHRFRRSQESKKLLWSKVVLCSLRVLLALSLPFARVISKVLVFTKDFFLLLPFVASI